MAEPTAEQVRTVRAALVHSPELEQFHYPPECPFSNDRARLLRQKLVSMGRLTGADRREVAPAPADTDTLRQFHSDAYLDVLKTASGGELEVEGLHMGLGTPETPVFLGLYEYAALACGAGLTAVDLLLSGQARVAFNPSGGYHHAGPATASGFCYVNDIVLACIKLVNAGKRVLFLDVDVHHGDGVESAFYDRSDVMTISLHETGKVLFPHTGFETDVGVGDGAGYAVNVPLPPGTYDDAYLRAFDAMAMPLMKAFDPDVIVLELGMDALSGDPLADLELTNNAHADVVRRVMGLGRPILATGGGGYNVPNTVRGWALAWSIFCEDDREDEHAFAGLGGVMLESTDWSGGLRDRILIPDATLRTQVDEAIEAALAKLRDNVFPYHGL